MNVFYWFTEMTSDALMLRIVHTESEKDRGDRIQLNEALAHVIFTVMTLVKKIAYRIRHSPCKHCIVCRLPTVKKNPKNPKLRNFKTTS